MIYFSFGDQLFKKNYRSCRIDIVIASKPKFDSPYAFLEEAAEMLVSKLNRDEYCHLQSKDCFLKLGAYSSIIEHWISSLHEDAEIVIDDIQYTFRVKNPGYLNPCEDVYVVSTPNEYMLFIWSTSD